jgi:sulfhydrogenase subunit beta (sulfur reductase)
MIHFLAKTSFNDFINAVSRNRSVFTHQKTGDDLHLVRTDHWLPDAHLPGPFRPVEPLKALVFPPRESLGGLTDDAGPPAVKERVVVGVKNCDLSSLEIHDYVFTSEPGDPYYKELRDKTAIVSCDCTDACEVCFCTAVNEQPYPKKGFDINLSPVSNGFIVETGSERGEKLCGNARQYLKPAERPMLAERDRNREALYKKVAGQAAKKGLEAGKNYQEAIRKTAESKLWDTFAADCVECGACNFSCCTCHCFLLADGMVGGKTPVRARQWDSCLYLNFARVAGGANPRRHRAERLYNRFDKKFNFFPQVLKRYACDGCGRCIEACTGKIDIRDVLKKALDETKSI